MKILVNLIDHANDTLEEVEEYAKQAYNIQSLGYRDLANDYIKISEKHIEIFDMLHNQMVLLIKETKAKNPDIPKGMMELWDHKHKELIKDLSMARYLIDEYKKTY